MPVYIIMLVSLAFVLFAIEHIKMPVHVRRTMYCICIIALAVIAGLRYFVGTDYAQYMRNYSKYLRKDLTFFSQPALSIVARLAAFIHNDYSTWFFIMSMITIVPVVFVFMKHNRSVGLCIIMYVFLGCWHYSFNLVKQSAAATVLFMGYGCLKDRKFAKWCTVCAIASMFHVSAVLMIPIYFLADSKISIKKIALIIAAGIMVALLYEFLFRLINILKQGLGTLSSKSDVRNNSVNVLRILVNCAPVLLYYVYRKLYNKNDPGFACLFNLSLINAVLNVASMQSIYLNRFCCYTNIFNALFIPKLLEKLRIKRRLLVFVILLLYCLFWMYDLYKGSSTVRFTWIFER